MSETTIAVIVFLGISSIALLLALCRHAIETWMEPTRHHPLRESPETRKRRRRDPFEGLV
jgi:hypothetical protein